MTALILLILISGFVFLLFLITLILSLVKKNKKLGLISLFFFFILIGFLGWTVFTLMNKSYHKITQLLKPRTGDEIYDALFNGRHTDCIKVLNYRDQVIPRIDCAIWLHFETCPEEVKRILSRHEFMSDKLPTAKWNGKIPYGEELSWFNPTTLGDTIMVYEYASQGNRNIQTIWINLDSTEVFVRDLLD